MTLVFPIVGIRHCMPEESVVDFICSLRDGAQVNLVYDNANAYDRYAIQAWMELKVGGELKTVQVGYVASDYAPMIRANYADDKFLYAQVVHPDTSMIDDTSFEVALDVDKMAIPAIESRIDGSPIAGIPLPMVPPEKKMLWEQIIAFSQTEFSPQEVLDLARKSEPFFGHGLSGDERTAYILMSTMLTFAHESWSEYTDAIWQMRMTLDDNHRDAFKTPERCAQVMAEEMEAVKQQTASFFDQYQAVLKAGLTTKEQQLQLHQQWLMALPDNLYAWLKDKPQFASKLYYERFSMDELQAIYLHLLCLEWLKNKKGLIEHTDTTRKRIEEFPYWDSYLKNDYGSLEEAYFRLQRAWCGDERYPVAALALEIKKLIKENRIDPPDMLSKFTSAINALLEIDLKTNSLAKHLRSYVKKGTEYASRKASRHKEKMQSYLSDYQ